MKMLEIKKETLSIKVQKIIKFYINLLEKLTRKENKKITN